MIQIRIIDGLPFIHLTVTYKGKAITIENAIVDTGSAGTVVSADILANIGVTYAPLDEVHRIRGVGGAEFVFSKRVDQLAVGSLVVDNFLIEVGGLDYGFEIGAIVGMDFLIQVGAVLDLAQFNIMPDKLSKST